MEKRMAKHRVYSISLASVHPLYIAKAERKGRALLSPPQGEGGTTNRTGP